MCPSSCTICSLHIFTRLWPHMVTKSPHSLFFEEYIFSSRFQKHRLCLFCMLELEQFNLTLTWSLSAQLFLRRRSTSWSKQSSILAKNVAFHSHRTESVPFHFAINLDFAQNLLEHILFWFFLLLFNFDNIQEVMFLCVVESLDYHLFFVNWVIYSAEYILHYLFGYALCFVNVYSLGQNIII